MKCTIARTFELPDDFMNPTRGFSHNCFYCPFQQLVEEVFICGVGSCCPFDSEGGWTTQFHNSINVGDKIEVLYEDKWQQGYVIDGYRTDDGIINIELDTGKKIWVGASRTDLYHILEK